MTANAKIDGVCEFIETLLDNNVKFLIFAHHHDMLNAIEHNLKKAKVGYIRIDGKVSAEKRHQYVKEF